MDRSPQDMPLRLAAFQWLEAQCRIHDDVLPRKLLELGFPFRGERITLIGQTGIWKPRQMQLPISITTTIHSPYSDTPGDQYIGYSYRGTDPGHRDNVGLRICMQKQIPLIYFYAVMPGKYLASWPTYIIEDDIRKLTFTAAVDEARVAFNQSVQEDEEAYIRRGYITSNVKVRIHQKTFRERVLYAYQTQCALCRLKHRELLDAAHIIADSQEKGDPLVSNGLSLCKIHHAAFDQNIIGITPDYTIKIRQDILEETDGPMLKYGIQSLENHRLILPQHKKDWPDRERLEQRFGEFLR
ncbi:MAG: HNH endonuclease [Candidatus Marinimicrobia bacterium]|nr:HNH endonuclease [Candidatus Neomarinimicrobiota bacterium]